MLQKYDDVFPFTCHSREDERLVTLDRFTIEDLEDYNLSEVDRIDTAVTTVFERGDKFVRNCVEVYRLLKSSALLSAFDLNSNGSESYPLVNSARLTDDEYYDLYMCLLPYASRSGSDFSTEDLHHLLIALETKKPLTKEQRTLAATVLRENLDEFSARTNPQALQDRKTILTKLQSSAVTPIVSAALTRRQTGYAEFAKPEVTDSSPAIDALKYKFGNKINDVNRQLLAYVFNSSPTKEAFVATMQEKLPTSTADFSGIYDVIERLLKDTSWHKN